MKSQLFAVLSWIPAMAAFAQNVGIGTINPAFKLDVAGRMRIQQTGVTAGIFFDGTSAAQRSFIGTLDNDHMGIYGAGCGWKFVFDVNNGNTGIGIVTPTATLDVNGAFRLRSNMPVSGSVLHSADVLGNAEWVNPVAFRAHAVFGDFTIPNDTWTKINLEKDYDYSAGFNPQTLQYEGFDAGQNAFFAIRKGIYHFQSQVGFKGTAANYFATRLVLKRSNNTSVKGNTEYVLGAGESALNYCSMLDVEVVLEPGDIVTIEGRARASSGTAARTIAALDEFTWFTGRLVVPL